MKVGSMRLLDRWIGAPISVLLTTIRRLADLFAAKPEGPPRRILLIKLIEQGATVIAEPALRRAVEMVGRENVFFVVFEENRFILDVLGVVPAENIITIRNKGVFVIALDTFRAVVRMRRERVDGAVDFEFFSRYSATLAYLSGAQRRVGFHSFGGEGGYRGDLMTHRIGYNVALHASQIYRVLVEALNLDSDQLPALEFQPDAGETRSQFRPTATEVREVKSLLRRLFDWEAIPPLMLLNANSGDLLPLRRWPPERYVELAQLLLERYPKVHIAFTGSPAEREQAEELAARVGSKRCVSVAGHTTLRQLFVLYCLADVLVTNDSGPAHYASLTPIDIVALFGPETPAVFGSRSPRSQMIWAGLACSPCVNAFNQRATKCNNNLCMQRISVAEVLGAVCNAYGRRPAELRRLEVA